MRLHGVMVSLVLALVATGLAVTASLLPRHKATPPVFRGTTAVYAIPVAGGQPRLVRVLPGQWGYPVPTADGRALVLEKPFLDHTETWRMPLAGGRLTRAGSMRVFTAPVQHPRYRATVWHTMHQGVVTVHNPDGTVAWQHAVFPQTSEYVAAPDGSSAVVAGRLRLVLLHEHSSRPLPAGLADASYSPDGRVIYAVRVNEAVSIPK